MNLRLITSSSQLTWQLAQRSRQSASGHCCFNEDSLWEFFWGHNVRLHLNGALLCSIGFGILFMLSSQGHFNQPLRCHVGTAEDLMREKLLFSVFTTLDTRWDSAGFMSDNRKPDHEPNFKKLHSGSCETLQREAAQLMFEWLDNHEGNCHPLGGDPQIKCASRHAVHSMPYRVKVI